MVDCYPDLDVDILELLLGTNVEVPSTETLYQFDYTSTLLLLEENGSETSSDFSDNNLTQSPDNSLNNNHCASPINNATPNPDTSPSHNLCSSSTSSNTSSPDTSPSHNHYVSSTSSVVSSPDNSQNCNHCVTPSPDTSLEQELSISSTKEPQNRKHSKSGTKSTPVNELLPPCRICGDKASGFHYGVNTCEACKGFFRRSLTKIEKKEEGYKCVGYGNCPILFGKRKSCSACRYKKCLSLGMSKNAIKTGRYTVEKRTQNIKEVKKLEAVAIGATLTNICNLTDNECQYIISRLVSAQRKIDPAFCKIFDKAFNLQKQNQVYEQYLKKKEMNVELSMLSKDLYDEIYSETGVDLDNRSYFLEMYAKKTMVFIENMADFIKSLPEMESISSDDQTKLLKESAADYWFLADHKMINPDLHVWNDFDGPEDLSMHKEEIQQWYKKPENIDELFAMARPFQRLDLTEEEVGIVRGIAVTYTDRCNLKQPAKIQEIQWKLTECLRWLLIKTTKNPEQRFCKILDRLILLRSLEEVWESLAEEELSWPEMQKYPILLEFYPKRSNTMHGLEKIM